jgi:hypothetical protein
MLLVEQHVLAKTFSALRTCGGGQNECVVYWTGSVDDPGGVDDVARPDHRAGPTWYEVEDNWITSFFLELRRARRTIRAQVHTHPGTGVRHSPTDDSFPIVPGEGFVSIVLPLFAMGPVDVTDSYIVVQQRNGSWTEAAPSEVITWS